MSRDYSRDYTVAHLSGPEGEVQVAGPYAAVRGFLLQATKHNVELTPEVKAKLLDVAVCRVCGGPTSPASPRRARAGHRAHRRR